MQTTKLRARDIIKESLAKEITKMGNQMSVVIEESLKAANLLAEEQGINISELSKRISKSKSYISNINARKGYDGALNLANRLSAYVDKLEGSE